MATTDAHESGASIPCPIVDQPQHPDDCARCTEGCEPSRETLLDLLRRAREELLFCTFAPGREQRSGAVLDDIETAVPYIYETYREPTREETLLRCGVDRGEQGDD